MSDVAVISCAELLARRFLPPSAKLQMSDNQSCHVRHPIRACFGVSCPCLDTSGGSFCLEIIIYQARMFIQTHKTTEVNFTCPLPFSKATFTCSGQSDLGFSCPDKPLVACYCREIYVWDVVGDHFCFSFRGGWSGLHESFVLFEPQSPKSVAMSYS